MQKYHKIKNIIIAIVTSFLYYYSCTTVPNNDKSAIVIGTIGIFVAVCLLMFRLDLMFGVYKVRTRKQEGKTNEL